MSESLEDRPIAAIKAYFESRGLPLTVHTSKPERPSNDEMRLHRSVRRAIQNDVSTHWVDLGRTSHYGSGRSEDEAIRSAAKRYRVEQAPADESA